MENENSSGIVENDDNNDCFIVSFDARSRKRRRGMFRRHGQITLKKRITTSGAEERSSGDEMATLDFCYIHNESTDTERMELDIQHVYVPQHLRGQGIAERIVRKAFALPAEQGHTDCQIIPSCTYVAHTFLPRHPELLCATSTHEKAFLHGQ